MGTPTPPPPVIGDNCVRGDGVLWPAGQTPKFVKLELTGLEKCPLCPIDAPNGNWWVEQDSVQPCLWEWADAHYWMQLFLQAASSILLVTSPEAPPNWYFFNDTAPPLEDNFTNELVVCVGDTGAKNGTGVVHWPGV